MLSSFLLAKASTKGKEPAVDSALDAIFSASAKPVATVPQIDAETVNDTNLSSSTAKRKRVTVESATPTKKRKRDRQEVAASPEVLNSTQTTGSNQTDSNSSSKRDKAKTPKTGKAVKLVEATDDIKDLGDRYSKQTLNTPKAEKRAKKSLSTTSSPPKIATVKSRVELVNGRESSEEKETQKELVHETMSSSGVVTGSKERKQVYVPDGETREQRDKRTVFVGNLPPDVVSSKPLQKSLKRHILSFSPTSGLKIESIRFRSVAFKTPTNPQALKDSEETAGSQRRKERAAAWRKDTQLEGEQEQEKLKEYLTPAEKKRIAFIKGEFHDQAASVNAYVVFAHSNPKEAITVDPYNAASLVVESMDGSMFEGRTLRVDGATKGDMGEGRLDRDPASTIFVGSLDFNAKEEDLRTFFETLLATELGPPPAKAAGTKSDSDGSNDEDEDEDDQKAETRGQTKWVRSVRVVRDKDTQLGKGFAYVRFSERTCVDEILMMEPSKLKFAKRKLRVDRCKTAPLGAKVPTTTLKRDARRSYPIKPGTKEVAEKSTSEKLRGDPSLGEKLKGLSKEERREAKKNDPTRQARRMDKKKARATLEKGFNKASKERVRERRIKSVTKSKDGSKKKHSKPSKS